MDFTIERASEGDAAKLVEALNKSFYEDYCKFGECPGYNVTVESMIERIREAEIYKFVSNGEIIGHLSLHLRDNGYIWIGCLDIIPEYQHNGIGSKAIRYALDRYPDIRAWGLETPVQNKKNCCFYEKMGFVNVSDKLHSDKLTLRLYEKTVNV